MLCQFRNKPEPTFYNPSSICYNKAKVEVRPGGWFITLGSACQRIISGPCFCHAGKALLTNSVFSVCLHVRSPYLVCLEEMIQLNGQTCYYKHNKAAKRPTTGYHEGRPKTYLDVFSGDKTGCAFKETFASRQKGSSYFIFFASHTAKPLKNQQENHFTSR